MKKTIAMIIAAVLLLTIPASAFAQSADPAYNELYLAVSGYAKSIDESVRSIKQNDPDYDLSSYNNVSGLVDTINSGKLEVLGYQVDIADPQAVTIKLGSLETEIVSQERVRELASSALKAAASVLAPIAAQLELDALAAAPLSAESLSERARIYGEQSSDLLEKLRTFLNENDMSAVLTPENVKTILVSLMSDPEGDIAMTLFSMLSEGLGAAKALEAGLLFAEISAMITRYKDLQADSQEWAKGGGTKQDAENIAEAFVSEIVDELLAFLKQPVIG